MLGLNSFHIIDVHRCITKCTISAGDIKPLSYNNIPTMRRDISLLFVDAVMILSTTTYAFQNNIITHHTSRLSPLFAKKSSSSGKGFGTPKKEPKYSIKDKSYDISSPISVKDVSEEQMSDFFSTYNEWLPLFRNILGDSSSSLASSFLSDVEHQEIWGISTAEQRNPWRLLPGKPTEDASLSTLSVFLDELQRSLLDIPLDQLITGDNDAHFLEEGRRTIAMTRFHVMEEYITTNSGHDEVEQELFKLCWSEIGHLVSQNEIDTGSLVLLPTTLEDGKSLEDVLQFIETNIIQPIHWLGIEDDWEVVALERGSIGVRMLYKLSDIPDLSEKYVPPESE